MARLALTLFFFVLAFSEAFSVSDRPGNDVISEPGEPVPPDPMSGFGSGSLRSDEVNVPVTFAKFHTINRHFPRRPLTATVHLHLQRYGHGGDADMGPDRWPLGVGRHIPASLRCHDDDDNEEDQMDMSYGQGDVINGITDEQEMGFRLGTRTYPEKEKFRIKKVEMMKLRHHGKEDNDREEDEERKEYKDLFMSKVRKFLTDLV